MDTTTKPPTKRERVRVAAASMVGTTIENYDFLAYGTAAAAYFGQVFFPGEDPLIGTLFSFGTLAVGFLTRPLGGVIAGHIGDRVGRKSVLVGSLVLMGVATLLIGLLPTYAQIGIAAPILLVLLRLIQGIGHGAEWGGAVLMSIEYAPRSKRGLFGSIPQVGVPLGLLLANGAFLLSGNLDSDWAWRAPFLLSGVLVIVGLIIRLSIEETPEFAKVKSEGRVEKSPIIKVLREDWRVVVRIIGLRLAETGGFYLTTTFVLSYLATQTSTDRSVALTGVVIGSAIGLVSHPIFGSLSDKLGRKPLYLAGAIVTVVIGVPLFMIMNTGNDLLIVLAVIFALVFSHDILFAIEASWFSEMFGANVRTSGISLGYQGASVIAGFVPFIATAAVASMGWVGPALLFSALGVITLVTALTTRETNPASVRAENREHDAAVVSAHASSAP